MTVRERFDCDAATGAVSRDLPIAQSSDPEQTTIVVVERAHVNFDAGTRYVSFFIPESEHWVGACNLALKRASETADLFATSVGMSMSHPELRVRPLDASQLPFSGRVYIYIDMELSDTNVDAVRDHGAQLGLRVDVRDRNYVRVLDRLQPAPAAPVTRSAQKPVAFISHANEDKKDVAKPLAEELERRGVPVWFDDFSLRVGDSLSESIDRGLKDSEFCVLVISPAFIANRGWAKREFASIQQRALSEPGIILPVWHNVDIRDVEELALWLADIKAAKTADGIEPVATHLVRSMGRVD